MTRRQVSSMPRHAFLGFVARNVSTAVFTSALFVGSLLLGCNGKSETADSTGVGEGKPPVQERFEPLSPTRGYVLLSIDTLRADHLGVYGYSKDTSPRLDAWAKDAVIFEQAFAQAPATLISHMSIFTALYPQEHGVIPPDDNVLSPEIPTLPELFEDAGFTTAGHTEGGYMHGAHGFARGFQTFSDDPYEGSMDVENTFARGVEFLEGLGDEEPFFLFLHTYSVHDPYFPPESFRPEGHELTREKVSAEYLDLVNDSFRSIESGEAERLVDAYDAGIRYFDGILGDFLDRLEALGLSDEITLILTSDHGEEFYEHSRLLHTQAYAEHLRIPLIVAHPEISEGFRVADTVRSVDLAPTLWQMAEIAMPEPISGKSLMPLLAGVSEPEPRRAYAEVGFVDRQRMVTDTLDGEIYQLVERRPLADPDGAWIARSLIFDHNESRLKLNGLSFYEARTVDVLADGKLVGRWPLLNDRWTETIFELPASEHSLRIELRADACVSPKEKGISTDPRCLGFKVQETERRRLELFNLSRDPAGLEDLSRQEPSILRRLARQLEGLRFEPVAEAGQRPMSEEERKALEALGYI